ncbi:hypothetical protein GFK32_25085, partial [Salmonella enterica subsp. enterica serovar Enteritidis]|nr:hypothetical protein [Salmonella enterica subsp. enterica serovar Enteritidis]
LKAASCCFTAASSHLPDLITGKAGTSVVNVYGINSTFSQDEIVNGHATLPDRTKGVFGGGVAIGYDFYDPFQLPVRLELDTTFRGETD